MDLDYEKRKNAPRSACGSGREDRFPVFIIALSYRKVNRKTNICSIFQIDRARRAGLCFAMNGARRPGFKPLPSVRGAHCHPPHVAAPYRRSGEGKDSPQRRRFADPDADTTQPITDRRYNPSLRGESFPTAHSVRRVTMHYALCTMHYALCTVHAPLGPKQHNRPPCGRAAVFWRGKENENNKQGNPCEEDGGIIW